jgi:hypothetical protein
MNKKQIIAHLEKEVYCCVKPSLISGVGVFAIKDIPKGTNPFKEKDTKYLPVTEQELVHVSPEIKEHIVKLFVFF